MDPFEADLRQRFFSKITPGENGCILWTGAKRPKGYGLMSVDGKPHNATHVSWRLKHGDWPEQHLLHRCDNPPCINPEHLFEGTNQDNVDDKMAKGRGGQLSGFEAPGAKLTGLEVSEIVALTETRMGLLRIGDLFGVSAAYVSQLRHGHSRGVGSPRRDKPKASNLVEFEGEMLSVRDIAERAGLKPEMVRRRIERGLTGQALIAPPHAAPRKPYVRRR